MDELLLRNCMIREGLSVKEGSVAERIRSLVRALHIAMPTKGHSDRICYRNIGNWLREKIDAGNFNADEVLPRVIDFALEASGPWSKNPPAVFISILKKELGYPK